MTFQEMCEKDTTLQRIQQQVTEGLSKYSSLSPYADKVGKILSQVLLDGITPDLLTEDGYLTQDALDSFILPLLKEGYLNVADIAKALQENINKGAEISFNAIKPAPDQDRLSHLAEKLLEREYSLTRWLLEDNALRNLTRSAITDTIRENARLHQEAGLHAYMARYSKTFCCRWCSSVSGVFEFGQQPEGFWKVHKDCNCIIEYKPSKYSQPDVITFVTGGDQKLRKITKHG